MEQIKYFDDAIIKIPNKKNLMQLSGSIIEKYIKPLNLSWIEIINIHNNDKIKRIYHKAVIFNEDVYNENIDIQLIIERAGRNLSRQIKDRYFVGILQGKDIIRIEVSEDIEEGAWDIYFNIYVIDKGEKKNG